MTVADATDAITRVHLAGRLDAAGADAIGLRFTATVVAKSQDAVIDLSGVTFIASLGLRLLISAARGVVGKGHRIALFGATEFVQGILDDAAIDQIMPVVATEDEAIAELAA